MLYYLESEGFNMLDESKQTEIQEEPVEEQVKETEEEVSSEKPSDVIDMLSLE